MIFQRGKRGTWWYRFRFAGRIIHESARTTSKTLAREGERQRRHELERKWNKVEKRTLPPTFSSAAERWLEKRKSSLTPSTVKTYGAAVKHLRAAFGATLVSDLTAAEIARFQQSRTRQGAAAATINKEVSCVRSTLKDCGLWAELQRDVRMLKERQDVGKALSPEEEARLLRAASSVGRQQGHWSPIYTVTALALNTGMRHAEIRRLQWKWVDLEKRVLIIARSKTDAGSGRCVPLNQPAWAALEMWAERFLNRDPQHYVFPACENGKFEPKRPISNWRTAWRNASRSAGLSGLRFHDLRHTATTKLLEQGVPFAVVAQIMGWSATTGVRMIKRYGHIRPEAQRRALEAIATAEVCASVHQIDNQPTRVLQSVSRN